MKIITVPIRIYPEDTDLQGIVYHANYLNFFDRARIDYLRSANLSLHKLSQSGIHLVVHSIKINYKASITFDDEVVASARIIKSGEVSVEFEQKINCQKTNKLFADGLVRIACIDNDREFVPIPKELLC